MKFGVWSSGFSPQRVEISRALRAKAQTTNEGFILLGVLILVMLISMVALSLMFRLRADETAAAAASGRNQAYSAAMAGVQEAMRIVKAIKPGLTDGKIICGESGVGSRGHGWVFSAIGDMLLAVFSRSSVRSR